MTRGGFYISGDPDSKQIPLWRSAQNKYAEHGWTIVLGRNILGWYIKIHHNHIILCYFTRLVEYSYDWIYLEIHYERTKQNFSKACVIVLDNIKIVVCVNFRISTTI